MLTKQEQQALAWAVASWARCLPPEIRNKGKEHPDMTAAHDKVRLARAALKKLPAPGVTASAPPSLTDAQIVQGYERWQASGSVVSPFIAGAEFARAQLTAGVGGTDGR